MTPEEENAEAFRIVAQRDLNDIRELKDFEPFNRYFMRRLKTKRDDIAEQFHDDPPEKCDKEKREHLRLLLKEYNSLIDMLDADMSTTRASLERMG